LNCTQKVTGAVVKSGFIMWPVDLHIAIQGHTDYTGPAKYFTRLITISLILGIPVLRSMNPCETARLIVYAARQIAFITKGGVRRNGYRPQSKSTKQRYILQGLPGIGIKRAERLLETFGSVEGVITASCEELASVEGSGKNVAEKIRWVVSEGTGRYETGDDLFIL
jgi:ERCC4-type nuclease